MDAGVAAEQAQHVATYAKMSAEAAGVAVKEALQKKMLAFTDPRAPHAVPYHEHGGTAHYPWLAPPEQEEPPQPGQEIVKLTPEKVETTMKSLPDPRLLLGLHAALG